MLDVRCSCWDADLWCGFALVVFVREKRKRTHNIPLAERRIFIFKDMACESEEGVFYLFLFLTLVESDMLRLTKDVMTKTRLDKIASAMASTHLSCFLPSYLTGIEHIIHTMFHIVEITASFRRIGTSHMRPTYQIRCEENICCRHYL